MPIRIQRKRTRGWRMPQGVVSCTRPGPFGNPIKVGMTVQEALFPCAHDESTVDSPKEAAELFDSVLSDPEEWKRMIGCLPDWADRILDRIEELRGKDLACWCRLDAKCHVDTLLKLANR